MGEKYAFDISICKIKTKKISKLVTVSMKNKERLITLLNVLYKLISGCISFRIKFTLNQNISDTQTGFLKQRYIGENTRFTYGLMDYTNNENIPGLLVLKYFEKAFDSMAWSFIYKVLQFFGFGNTIIDWVKILNNDFKAAVLQ